MRDLDKQAQDLRGTIDESHQKRSQVYQNGKRDGEDVTFKDLITKNIDEVKKLRNEKKVHFEKLNDLKHNQNTLETQKSELMKNIPRNYQKEEDIHLAIQEMQVKYETSSMSNAEEKKLLKDIDFLKKAVPDMKKLWEIEPQLVKIRD